MAVNTTLTNCANITSVVWSEGQHNVTIWANDSAGNENHSSVTFTVDVTPPTYINLINHTLSSNNSFYYDLDAIDNIGIESFSLNSTAYFDINSTGTITNNTNLSRVEIHWLKVTVKDYAQNALEAEFYINITGPEITKCSGNFTTIKIPVSNNRPYIKLCNLIDFR